MTTSKNNNSLSARVKRRNKRGFKGIGTTTNFYDNPRIYGDYKLNFDNHKHDTINPIKEQAVSTGKKHYHKHVGSKPLKKLIKILHDFCNPTKDLFEIIEKRKKKNNK